MLPVVVLFLISFGLVFVARWSDEGKALSYQVLADWASHGLGSAILPKSKILPHISKRQIFKSNKPAKISFEARWLLKANKPLKKMIQHFKNHIDEIVRGIAE